MEKNRKIKSTSESAHHSMSRTIPRFFFINFGFFTVPICLRQLKVRRLEDLQRSSLDVGGEVNIAGDDVVDVEKEINIAEIVSSEIFLSKALRLRKNLKLFSSII